MVVSLTNTQPFFYASGHASIKQQSNPPKILSIPVNFPSKKPQIAPLSISQKNTLFTYSKYNHNHNHGSDAFKCFVSIRNENFTNIEEEEDDGETKLTADKKKRESVESLTRFYKEAVLVEDYHMIAEVETALYRLEKENSELVEKLSTMSDEITSGNARYVRLQADFDNFRKRSEKERLLVRSDAQGEVIESLLPMVDSFERAKQQIKPETNREKQIDTSYQGIYKQFFEIMRSFRVSIVATVGKPFDPSLHEAIAREESEEYREGIVSQEFRRGFILGDRLLRPAMVKVSSGPGK